MGHMIEKRGRDPRCKNGPRFWLKVRNRTAAPFSIMFDCGDKYIRSWREREWCFLYQRVETRENRNGTETRLANQETA